MLASSITSVEYVPYSVWCESYSLGRDTLEIFVFPELTARQWIKHEGRKRKTSSEVGGIFRIHVVTCMIRNLVLCVQQ